MIFKFIPHCWMYHFGKRVLNDGIIMKLKWYSKDGSNKSREGTLIGALLLSHDRLASYSQNLLKLHLA